ncbi:hypothetical protein FOMPIDRAFT_93499 [Fomitopsis schrenkii]|uniref:DUF6534 domain-containing protein n=1 Tax=Fomitopsis schrenkii TaxID=2126942 RepID=S8DN96_FOMSC|nr:hypothetical protein FOMPIDRAFT_93499 [Fomitopsis schrenkii]
MTTEAVAIAQAAQGPAFIGIFINVMLYGAMLTQTFFYYSTYKHDPTWLKFYVAILFLADTVNTVFDCAWIYGVLINNFGNIAALGVGNLLFQTDQAMTGIISMQVQFFYAWRIHKLTGNKLLVGAVLISSAVGGLSGIGTAIGVGILPQLAGLQRLTVIVSLWLAGSAASDVIIASALTWHLNKQRTGFAYTDSMVSKIMTLILSNGALTAVFAVADLIAYLASIKGYHLIFNFSLAKLYGNSAMSSLNARVILKNAASSSTSQGEAAPRATASRLQNDIIKSGSGRPTQIMVAVETHELTDVSDQDAKLRMEWQTHSVASDVKGEIVAV